jgi:RNase P subunit RPR2
MNEKLKRTMELLKGIKRYTCPKCKTSSFTVEYAAVSNDKGQDVPANMLIVCSDCGTVIAPYNPDPVLPD